VLVRTGECPFGREPDLGSFKPNEVPHRGTVPGIGVATIPISEKVARKIVSE
jgi:hypothetical protein